MIPSALVGFVGLLALSAQAVPTPKDEDWRLLPTAPLSLSLGDHGCGEGFHQALWRETRRDIAKAALGIIISTAALV